MRCSFGLVGVPPSSGPRGFHLDLVPGAVLQPQRPRERYEDEAEGVPRTEVGNLRYNHSAFPFELIPPCSIFLSHELILRYIYIYLSFSLQGTMTVTEYRDHFLQLARYAPAEVADDRKKQEHFMEGLEDYL